MAAINFTTAYATTLQGVLPLSPDTTIYAEDLGLCQECLDVTSSCFACLQTSQQVFSDVALTIPVVDGYYMIHYYEGSLPAIWHIIGGYPQEDGFFNAENV
jgi:hypothetical protein